MSIAIPFLAISALMFLFAWDADRQRQRAAFWERMYNESQDLIQEMLEKDAEPEAVLSVLVSQN